MTKSNRTKRPGSNPKRRAKRATASDKVVMQPWSRRQNREPHVASALGPYESCYNITMGYGADRSIEVP